MQRDQSLEQSGTFAPVLLSTNTVAQEGHRGAQNWDFQTVSPLGSFCPGMRGANAGLCGYICSVANTISLLWEKEEALTLSCRLVAPLSMGDYLDQPLQSWIPPLRTILWGRGREAHRGDIQNVRPSKTIVWDQDKVLSPLLGSGTLRSSRHRHKQ